MPGGLVMNCRGWLELLTNVMMPPDPLIQNMFDVIENATEAFVSESSVPVRITPVPPRSALSKSQSLIRAKGSDMKMNLSARKQVKRQKVKRLEIR